MSEHTIKYTVTPFVDFNKETLGLDIKLPDGQIDREVMNLKERAIREGLIALGWTPPGIADKLAAAIQFTKTHHNLDPEECLEHLTSALAAYENHKKPDQQIKQSCDCIEKCGKYWIQRCDCQNSTSLAEAQSWCDHENNKKQTP